MLPLRLLWRCLEASSGSKTFERYSLVEEILAINEHAQKVSTEIWRAECKLLTSAFGVVANCVKEWDRSGYLSTVSSNGLLKELLRVLRSGLHILPSASRDRRGWEVRTLFITEEIKYVIQQLVEFISMLCIMALQEDLSPSGKCKIRMMAMISVTDMRDLHSKLGNAADMDREVVLRLLDERLKGIWRRKYAGFEELRRIVHHGSDREMFSISYRNLVFRKHIGSGRFGSVYEASWLDQVVAVKVFREGDFSFEKEFSTLVVLPQHPNIVGVIGFTHDSKDKQYAIVMEKMNMDLDRFIQQHKKLTGIPLVTSLSIMLQIAEGMRFLHSENVIHRDLKPQNILLKFLEDGVLVKISDFGTARANYFTSLVSSPTVGVGTRIYRAPEVFRSENTEGQAKYSKKADVYSFSIVCFHLISGNLPFEDILGVDFAIEVCAKKRRPELPEDCPEELATLIKRCWSPDASDRPDFAEVCESLKQLRSLVLTKTSHWSEASHSQLGGTHQVRTFSQEEIVMAVTRNDGKWSDGTAYRGILETGEEVSVDVLKQAVPEIELQFFCRMKHPNIVRLVGYCNQDGHYAAVTEYIPHGSLIDHFQSGHRHNSIALDWRRRIDTAIGVARGLCHLHSLEIVHGNVHPTTVFLSGEDSEGKIKFPLSSEGQQYQGYDDPVNSLCSKSDVYGFGIIMLRLVTIQAATERSILKARFRDRGIQYFSEVHLDPELRCELLPAHSAKVNWYLELAMKCLAPAASQRPSMHDIVLLLLDIRNWGEVMERSSSIKKE